MLILTDTIMIDNVSAITIENQPVLNDTDSTVMLYDIIAKGDISVTIATFDNKASAIRLLHSIQDEYAKGSKIVDLRTFSIAQLDETINKMHELRQLAEETDKTKQKIAETKQNLDKLKTKLNTKYDKTESEADDNAKKEETRE